MLTIAAAQHQVIKLAQLLDCGLTASGVRDRVAAQLLFRQYEQVYAAGRSDLTQRGHWMAAVLACGDDAVLSHASAAALHGIRSSAAATIDITVRRPSSLHHAGIRLHRRATFTAADVTVVDGIPVTSLARTLLDLASRFSDSVVERAGEQAVVLELFDLRAVSELLGRSKGQRGIRRLRRVLELGDLGENVPASGLEVRYRELCRRAGLPTPEINRYLLLGDEYHKVDFLWRRERVVIETDGGRYHASGWQRARDERRDQLLTKHGFAHARLPDELVDDHPDEAIAIARNLLTSCRVSTNVA